MDLALKLIKNILFYSALNYIKIVYSKHIHKLQIEISKSWLIKYNLSIVLTNTLLFKNTIFKIQKF